MKEVIQITPEQVRKIIQTALKTQLATEVINCDDTAVAQVRVAMQVVAKISDEQLEEKMVELFTEATQLYNS